MTVGGHSLSTDYVTGSHIRKYVQEYQRAVIQWMKSTNKLDLRAFDNAYFRGPRAKAVGALLDIMQRVKRGGNVILLGCSIGNDQDLVTGLRQLATLGQVNIYIDNNKVCGIEYNRPLLGRSLTHTDQDGIIEKLGWLRIDPKGNTSIVDNLFLQPQNEPVLEVKEPFHDHK